MPKTEEKIDVAILKTDIAYLKRDVNEIKTVLLSDIKSQIKDIKDTLDSQAVRWQEFGGLTKGLVDLQSEVNTHAKDHHEEMTTIKEELDDVRKKQWLFSGAIGAIASIPLVIEIIDKLKK